jgi:hypothetical protein
MDLMGRRRKKFGNQESGPRKGFSLVIVFLKESRSNLRLCWLKRPKSIKANLTSNSCRRKNASMTLFHKSSHS